MDRFDHERIEVYQLSLEFIRHADLLVQSFPPGRSYLADQLNRAASSIVLNIAEGAGEFSKKEKMRFYRMARRSATECAGLLDITHTLLIANEKQFSMGREMLLRIVSMLIAVIRSIDPEGKKEGRGGGRGTGTGATE